MAKASMLLSISEVVGAATVSLLLYASHVYLPTDKAAKTVLTFGSVV